MICRCGKVMDFEVDLEKQAVVFSCCEKIEIGGDYMEVKEYVGKMFEKNIEQTRRQLRLCRKKLDAVKRVTPADECMQMIKDDYSRQLQKWEMLLEEHEGKKEEFDEIMNLVKGE